MQRRHLSYDDIHQQVKLLSFRITADGFSPSVVVGVCRGGLLPATLISQNWRLPMTSLNVSLRDQTLFEPEQALWLKDLLEKGHTLLVVDDINDSGHTINWIKQNWTQVCEAQAKRFEDQIRFATLLNKSTSSAKVDYWALQIDADQKDIWWVFPWENL